MSVYQIQDDTVLPIKGSSYRINDLLNDEKLSDRFRDGLCLVLRLQASDYHHFCCFDNFIAERAVFIPGQLHSVQPIACENYPVFRLNRRWYSVLESRSR